MLFKDDSSRVQLDMIDDDPNTSYVNASYIPVSHETNALRVIILL